MEIERFHVGARMAQLVKYNGFAFLAGQVADDPAQDVRGQTAQILAKIDALLAEMEALAQWAEQADSSDWFGKSLIEIDRAFGTVRRAERVRPRDHDALEGLLALLVALDDAPGGFS